MAAARNDLVYRAWRLLHPGQSFAEFYVWQVTRKLDRGGAHKTLGKRRIGQGSIFGAAPEHDLESFASHGRTVFAELLELGLRPDQKVVDYGCGSLRIGQHCIDFLEPGNYVGLDVTDRFFRDGAEILGARYMATKRAEFFVIGDDVLIQVAARQPDLIFTAAVTQHVPPFDLGLYLDRLCSLKGRTTRLIVYFVAAEHQVRLKGKSWAYPPGRMAALLAARCPGATLRILDSALQRRPTKVRAWEGIIVVD